MPFPLILIIVTHFYLVSVFRYIQKNIFLCQLKNRGHDKGYERLIRGLAGGDCIFLRFDYMHQVELEYQISMYHGSPSGTFSDLAKLIT